MLDHAKMALGSFFVIAIVCSNIWIRETELMVDKNYQIKIFQELQNLSILSHEQNFQQIPRHVSFLISLFAGARM